MSFPLDEASGAGVYVFQLPIRLVHLLGGQADTLGNGPLNLPNLRLPAIIIASPLAERKAKLFIVRNIGFLSSTRKN